MGKYAEFSQKVLENVGGLDNITFVAHCATRLRISYADGSKINEAAIKALPECAGIVKKANQLQIIIGPQVPDAYYDFLEVSGWKEGMNENAVNVPKEKKSILDLIADFFPPIFMPIMPALVVGGMVLAIRTLCVNYFGLDVSSGTAQLLTCFFNAGFEFLPIYIGYSYAQKLKLQPILGMFLGGCLVCSRYQSGVVTDFLGIPIEQVSYGSMIIPVILGTTLIYFLDKYLKKIIPNAVIYFVKPVVTMLIVVPVTFLWLGPLGTWLSTYIGYFVTFLMDTLGVFALPILCALCPYFVMFGVDKALSPLGIELLATLGYNNITAPQNFISNIGVGAVALAIAYSAVVRKDKVKRGMIVSTAITALCGVTEPAFYGSLIALKEALLGHAIGTVIGGFVGALFGLRTYISASCPGFLTFLSFINPETGSLQMVWYAAITAAVTVAACFIATSILIKRSESKKAIAG